MKSKLMTAIAAASTLLSTVACEIEWIQLPARATANSAVTMKVTLGEADRVAPVTLCSSLPNGWTLNAVTCTASTGVACTLTADADAAAAKSSIADHTWRCWQGIESSDGMRGEATFELTVGAAGHHVAYVSLDYESDGYPPQRRLASRSISVDSLPAFDANLERGEGVDFSGLDTGVVAGNETDLFLLRIDELTLSRISGTSSQLGVLPRTEVFATGLAWGNGVFVATGNARTGGPTRPGYVWRSTDGVTWTEVQHTFRPLYTVVYSPANNGFVASADGQIIYLSPDGITWTDLATDASGPSAFGTATAGAAGTVFDTGDGSYLLHTDNTTLSRITLEEDGITLSPRGYAYAPRTGYVTVSETGVLYTSPDVTTFEALAFGVASNTRLLPGALFVYAQDEDGHLLRVEPNALVPIGSSTSMDLRSFSTTGRTIFRGSSDAASLDAAFVIEHPRLAATVTGTSVIVRNSGRGTLHFDTPTVTGNIQVSGCNEHMLPAGATCTYTVAGDGTGTVTLNSNGVIDPASLTLNVDLTPPVSDEDPASGGGSDDGCVAAPASLYACFAAALLVRRRRPGPVPSLN